MTREKPKQSGMDRFLDSRAGKLLLFALFAPFAIVYALGFLGFEPPMGGAFGIWFMGALTVCGVVTTVNFAGGIKAHGLGELGCVVPLAAVTCWWGYVFLKEIGALE